jgi:Nucleotidyl transferase AbiEii toxin, Type IV TA system
VSRERLARRFLGFAGLSQSNLERYCGGSQRSSRRLSLDLDLDLDPIPFSVNTYKMPDLFAGKLHAVLHRKWRNRVKGRDYYDFVWYVARDVPVHLSHLEKRLRQSEGWTMKREMQQSDLLGLLEKKFEQLDVDIAKKEVAPFLRDPAAVDLWSREFFTSLLSRLKTE